MDFRAESVAGAVYKRVAVSHVTYNTTGGFVDSLSKDTMPYSCQRGFYRCIYYFVVLFIALWCISDKFEEQGLDGDKWLKGNNISPAYTQITA